MVFYRPFTHLIAQFSKSLFPFLAANVFEQQHIYDPTGSAVVKSGLMFKSLRIVKSAEQDIEKGQIGIVMLVNTLCVVVAVTFRTLYDVAQPAGCIDIGVLENAEKVRDQ